MKRIILILSVTTLCSCCAIRQTDQDIEKRIADVEASNWILRSQNTHKDSVIVAYKDSLWRCREDNVPAKQFVGVSNTLHKTAQSPWDRVRVLAFSCPVFVQIEPLKTLSTVCENRAETPEFQTIIKTLSFRLSAVYSSLPELCRIEMKSNLFTA